MKQELAVRLIQNMEQVIKGKREVLELFVTAFLAGGHVLLEDVPGCGKTTLAKALAASTGCSFGRIQFTPDTLPQDITGSSVYNMKTGEFSFVKGTVMNQVVLADEINRTSPKTQASLLEAMEEHQVTADGNTYRLSEPFFVIATQNPSDFVGTYALPEAQLDRFLMKLSMGYPEAEDEKDMIGEYVLRTRNLGDSTDWNKIGQITDTEEICAVKKEILSVSLHEKMAEYLVLLSNQTRTHKDLRLGISPRAVLAMVAASRACACLDGRDFVKPEDVKKMWLPVLSHRVVLTAEAKLKKKRAENILLEILTETTIPV